MRGHFDCPVRHSARWGDTDIFPDPIDSHLYFREAPRSCRALSQDPLGSAGPQSKEAPVPGRTNPGGNGSPEPTAGSGRAGGLRGEPQPRRVERPLCRPVRQPAATVAVVRARAAARSSSRKSGWAIPISASARSRMLRPKSRATPCSVTT